MIIYSQSKLFCIFFLLGLLLNIIFDLFRGLRKTIKFSNALVLMQDVLFLLISGFLFFKTLLIFSNGEIRLYMIIAMLFGIAIYSLTISSQCVIIISLILKGFLNIFYLIKKVLFIPFNITKNIFCVKIKGKSEKIQNILIR